jgi:two-component system sensor histidine kinase KdpD
MTENTLQWARLAGEGQSLQLDWQSVEEIIGSVRARMRQRDPSHRVRAEVPPGLPLVRADPVLLGQLLENLVDNALKYSEGPVDIQARQEGVAVSVAVKDRGPGLSDEELCTVFDSFTRGAAAPGVRGVGLGLAVCQAIARTHGATLQARRRRGGGSSFVLSLPVHEQPPVIEQ